MSIFKNFSFDKLKSGLSKTKNNLVTKISETVTGKVKIDAETIEDIEEILISSDVGSKTTERILDQLKTSLLKESNRSIENIQEVIKRELIGELSEIKVSEFDFTKSKPYVILIIGVNGSGKTTSIGKLASNFKALGKKVIIGSADTFRAAANDQLEIWAMRAGVPVVSSNSKDPSAVAYDTLLKAREQDLDIILIDTAGRLHTQKNLMDELGKIKKVISNLIPTAPHDVFLVLDGTSGQNGFYQVNEFKKYAEITGLIITKLDGTAKGGIIFKILSEFNIPVRFIGVGEGIDDLQEFNAENYVNAIFD